MKKFSKAIGFVLFAASVVLWPGPSALAQGKFEFSGHYGRWSVNIFKGMIESAIGDALETEFRDKLVANVQQDNPLFQLTQYHQVVRFDSGGPNYGFELRWYPGGEYGSFSLGFSYEKTTMKVGFPEVAVDLTLEEQGTGQTGSMAANVHGEFLLKPSAVLVSFRWDIFPRGSFHPYITFGLGMAGGSALDEGLLSYGYTADFNAPDINEHYEDEVSKTLKELKEEMEAEVDPETGEPQEFFLPNFLPFLQLHLGMKFTIVRKVQAFIDYGVLDGFLLRGGLAVRF
jgi:hypothetical protein